MSTEYVLVNNGALSAPNGRSSPSHPTNTSIIAHRKSVAAGISAVPEDPVKAGRSKMYQKLFKLPPDEDLLDGTL